MANEYNVFVLALATLGAYAASLHLVRAKRLTLIRHRKIWNLVLLVSFAVSGFIGMLMTFLIDSGIRIGSYYSTILWLHVELGIVMAVVATIHLYWHAEYYLGGYRAGGNK
jgi:hypothetical protein